MPDRIRIGLEALARSRPSDSCIPACFQAESVWPDPDSQPEQNRVCAGFAQYYSSRVWKNATESESGKLVAGRLHSARNGSVDSCRSVCLQTRCVRPKRDQAIQVGSGPVLHNTIRAFFGKTEANRKRKVGSGMYDPDRF